MSRSSLASRRSNRDDVASLSVSNMNHRSALFLAAILVSGCVGSAPGAAPEGVNDGGLSDDAGLDSVDGSSLTDVGEQDGDAGLLPDGGAPTVATFGTTQEAFRVGFDAVDVTGRFVVQDADGNDIDCPGGVGANQIVGNTLASARVNGDQFLFTADQPGRTELSFTCQSLRTRVEVTVLPAPNRLTDRLAAWVRPDIGVQLNPDGTHIATIENIVDGRALEPKNQIEGPRLADLVEKAIRFGGAQSLTFDPPIAVSQGHILLVYRSQLANTNSSREPILGGVPGASYENVLAIPGTNGVGVSLTTSRYQPSWLVYDFTPGGWSVDSRNLYTFTIGPPIGDLRVSLGVGSDSAITKSLPAAMTGENDFLVEQLGSDKDAEFANGVLFELIVFDEPLDTDALQAVKDYIFRRY